MKNRIELHAKTKYSMDHESTVDIKDLILKCSSNGEKGVAIVDSGTILSFYKAEKILKELNLKDFKLIYGVEVNVDLNNNKYKAVILLKRRKGLSVLYRLLSPYFTTNELLLNELMQNREDFLIGLIYDENNYNPLVLQFFNYIEVDNKVSKEVISTLKKDNLVVYSNRINALSKDEEFCKKISHTKGDQLQIINLEHMKLTREIANVIENYNEMANKMNEYLVREIIYDKNQRKIQSKMLRYQINPHFLYNTLNLIASMGELSDFPEIVEITKNLSCIMQYNVKGSRFVSLKTEVEMVKAYLEIQRIRFHDCFSVEYEIERQIEQVRIVKFILQPIVENIFEHGFTMDENDNKIWIKAFKCENDIVILVKDNGCGIDSEKREELNRILCERTRRISYIDEEEKSIGINNVNTRIKNYYGEKYGVKVNKADKGTEIQLLLGIENLEEENKDK